jgi:thiol-disulfide isomerase/thioredoxin
MPENDRCREIRDGAELEKALKTTDKVFVLFYASWCPFSQRFLPEFIDSAGKCREPHARFAIDDHEDITERYSIEVYPTVMYFEGGKPVKRLDSAFHEGLTRNQLQEFINICTRNAKNLA